MYQHDTMTKRELDYANDGKCHNAEPGTHGHECGKPAEWLGITHMGYAFGFCDACKRSGYESRGIRDWSRYDSAH